MLRRIVYALLLAGMTAIILRWISLERWRTQSNAATPTPVALETPTPTPIPTATRAPSIPGRPDLSRLFNGITLRTELETVPGGAASVERVDPESYLLKLKLHARVPSPNGTLDEIAKVSPELPGLLPGLASMVKPEAVAPFFTQLYETKVRELKENLSRLDLLLSRHNFFDCQTVMQLKHPQSGRRALLFQADMDVDADGSDGDRLPGGTGVYPTFKPFTSFRWAKKTGAANPYLAATEDKLKRVEAEASRAPAERKRELKNNVAQLRDETGALKKFSYLIGATDPFIVVPGSFTKGSNAVKVGDYAVVAAAGKLYPAIVGDVGPNDRIGEASLRIAKEVNAASNPNNRPISELKATYLVFNGTADPSWGPPDLEKLQNRCEALVQEIGGANTPLHHWENIIPPPPTPTPSPTPSPALAPSPSATEPATASPSATFAFPTTSPTSTP